MFIVPYRKPNLQIPNKIEGGIQHQIKASILLLILKIQFKSWKAHITESKNIKIFSRMS